MTTRTQVAGCKAAVREIITYCENNLKRDDHGLYEPLTTKLDNEFTRMRDQTFAGVFPSSANGGGSMYNGTSCFECTNHRTNYSYRLNGTTTVRLTHAHARYFTTLTQQLHQCLLAVIPDEQQAAKRMKRYLTMISQVKRCCHNSHCVNEWHFVGKINHLPNFELALSDFTGLVTWENKRVFIHFLDGVWAGQCGS